MLSNVSTNIIEMIMNRSLTYVMPFNFEKCSAKVLYAPWSSYIYTIPTDAFNICMLNQITDRYKYQTPTCPNIN